MHCYSKNLQPLITDQMRAKLTGLNPEESRKHTFVYKWIPTLEQWEVSKPLIKPGMRVELIGLHLKPLKRFNGNCGSVVKWNPAKKMWVVRMDLWDEGGVVVYCDECVFRPTKLKLSACLLPTGWTEKKHATTNRPYYWYERHRLSQFKRPGFDWAPPALPEGWIETTDVAQNKAYYVSPPPSSKATWDRPSKLKPLPPAEPVWIPVKTTTGRTLSHGWTEQLDTATGQMYYSNEKRNIPQCLFPDRRRLAGHPVFRRLLHKLRANEFATELFVN